LQHKKKKPKKKQLLITLK